MLTRLTQLLAKLIAAIAVPAAVWLGADESQTALVVEQSALIAGAVVSLLAIGFDLLLHRVETGSVFQRAGSKTDAKFIKTYPANGQRLPLLGLALLPALLTGCASSALQAPAEHLVATVFPEHRAYVEADESLSREQKDVRLDLLDAFETTVAMGRERGPATIIAPPTPRQ